MKKQVMWRFVVVCVGSLVLVFLLGSGFVIMNVVINDKIDFCDYICSETWQNYAINMSCFDGGRMPCVCFDSSNPPQGYHENGRDHWIFDGSVC